MDLPSKTDALSALLGQDTETLPTCQGVYQPTSDFVSEVTDQTPEITTLADIQSITNKLMQSPHSREVAEFNRTYILSRSEQAEKLKGLGPHVLLDIIASGMLPSRLSKALQVSYATLDLYLEKNCDAVDLDRAHALAADMLIEEGRVELEACDEGSKLGIMKATEIAKNNLMIAKALSSKYSEKRAADIQVNTQINNVTGEGKKESWLRMLEPELEDLPPLPEHKPIQQVEDDALNNADIEDGEFKFG